MSNRLEQIKLQMLGPKCQVTLFDVQGKIIESCETVLKTEPSQSIFNQFDFLLGIQEVLQTMEKDSPLQFDLVEWEEQKEALLGMTFTKIDEQTIQWFISDRSEEKSQILSVQQSRNNAAINEELLEIRQKLLESEQKLLAFKNEELLRVQKFKERFFAEVSHEMRTPLNSISGLVELLEQNKSGDYLHALKATSQHLNHIINDILDLSKVEEGKLELQMLPFDLAEITDSVIKGFNMAAKEKKIEVSAEIAPEVPKYIVADPIRLSQVLYNIMGNAVKFTREGSVKLHVELQEKHEEDHLLTFSIKDTGIGMSTKNIQKILEPYAQVEGQSYYEYGGTGLGMGIAQRLIEVMGSKLSIESEQDKGTIMSFQVNCKEANSAAYSIKESTRSEAVDLSQYTILFAEDDPTNTLILKDISAQWKLNASFVNNGKALSKELNEAKYDLLITDIDLGDLNSLDIVNELRKGSTSNNMLPIIFLSGDGKAAHFGLSEITNSDFLVKPINPESLLMKIYEMLDKPAEHQVQKIDLTNLKESVGGNLEFLSELIDTILEHLDLDLNKLVEAASTNDYEGARKLLHKMKPSISYLGIQSLVEERQRLHDKVAEAHSIKNEISPFHSQLKQALGELAEQKEEIIKG